MHFGGESHHRAPPFLPTYSGGTLFFRRVTETRPDPNEESKMKFNINWKELGKKLWQAVWPVIAGAITGGGIVAVTGCSSMQPSDKTQSISLYALGIPGVAVVTSTQQTADNKGDDTNDAKQTNPVSVKLPTK